MSESRSLSEAYARNIDYMLDAAHRFFASTPHAPQGMLDPASTDGLPVLQREVISGAARLYEKHILVGEPSTEFPDEERLFAAAVREDRLCYAAISQSGHAVMGEAPFIPHDPEAQRAAMDNHLTYVPYSLADPDFRTSAYVYSVEDAADLVNGVIARLRHDHIREMLPDFDSLLQLREPSATN